MRGYLGSHRPRWTDKPGTSSAPGGRGFPRLSTAEVLDLLPGDDVRTVHGLVTVFGTPFTHRSTGKLLVPVWSPRKDRKVYAVAGKIHGPKRCALAADGTAL